MLKPAPVIETADDGLVTQKAESIIDIRVGRVAGVPVDQLNGIVGQFLKEIVRLADVEKINGIRAGRLENSQIVRLAKFLVLLEG